MYGIELTGTDQKYYECKSLRFVAYVLNTFKVGT